MESASNTLKQHDHPLPRLTTMQGRLLRPTADKFQCFPRDGWEEEFASASAVPLDGLEWIYDLHGLNANPLETESGLARMKELSARHHVTIHSLCADYFMDLPLLRVTDGQHRERLDRLHWLVRRCERAGIQRVVLPFVDSSRIETLAETDLVIQCLRAVLPTAEVCGIELHLETALAPTPFGALLDRLNHPLIKVNYDSGNSASLGYHPREEFQAYGSRLGSVHIKDRLRDGATVPLGTGSTDFKALRECLSRRAYNGDFVLQVARGQPGDEVNWVRQHRRFVLDWWGDAVAKTELVSISQEKKGWTGSKIGL
jgi:hexulose-6-phosphate isomerase